MPIGGVLPAKFLLKRDSFIARVNDDQATIIITRNYSKDKDDEVCTNICQMKKYYLEHQLRLQM